jgi:hypothetical protein
MAARRQVPVDSDQDARFDQAFERLTQLVDLRQADALHPVRGNSVYLSSVVLWMLVYQRMNPDTSLEAAVKKLIEARPDFLPRNKRVQDGTLSTNTSTYSQARSRLPLEVAEWFAAQVSWSLIEASSPTLNGRRAFLIDGTTLTLAPEPQLQRAFPPASNQHGEGVWPVALLVVAHELASGAALVPEVGAMYGPHAVSETALVQQHLKQLPPGSVVLADAGFGIFAVAHAAASAGHAFVFRLTRQRFDALVRDKQTRLVAEGDGPSGRWRTWSHVWTPTAKVRRSHPDLPEQARLDVRLHEIIVSPTLTLLLVSDLGDEASGASAAVLADLYARRVDVEVDIRNLKVVLDSEHIRARSVDTFHKELLGSVVSYNLVTQFRRQAAQLNEVPPRRMSFKRTWTTYRQFLLPQMYTEAASWREQYRKALHYAMQDKLPHRPDRSFAREAYPKRPKSNAFKKRLRKPPSTG